MSDHPHSKKKINQSDSNEPLNDLTLNQDEVIVAEPVNGNPAGSTESIDEIPSNTQSTKPSPPVVQKTKPLRQSALPTKIPKTIKFSNRLILSQCKLKIESLRSWLSLMTEIDELWTNAKHSACIQEYNQLFLRFDGLNEQIKEEMNNFRIEVESDFSSLLTSITRKLKSLFAQSEFEVSGDFPTYSLSINRGNGISSTSLTLTILNNPCRKDKNWILEVDGQEVIIDETLLVERLTDMYDYKFHQSLQTIDMNQVFVSVMIQIATFAKQEPIQLYLKDFFRITQDTLGYNNFLASLPLIQEEFERSFLYLAQKYGCKLDHARDKTKFVKLTIDGQENEYSYFIFNKSTFFGGKHNATID